MNLHLNGRPIETAGPTLIELLQEQGIDHTLPGIAVAVNDEVVPRASWRAHILGDGDSVEVITAMQGG